MNSSQLEATHRIDVAIDHPAFDGHFPGQPMLPGVALLAEVIEALLSDPALLALVGSVPQPSVVKFLHPVTPGARLAIRFDATARALKFSVHSVDGAFEAASGQFELAPVVSSLTDASTAAATSSSASAVARPATS